jgi:hypothetical protein
MRRAAAELLGAIRWRALAAAWVLTMVATGVLVATDAPPSTTALVIGALAAVVTSAASTRADTVTIVAPRRSRSRGKGHDAMAEMPLLRYEALRAEAELARATRQMEDIRVRLRRLERDAASSRRAEPADPPRRS